MGVWQIDVEGLARSRFTVSALVETLTALDLLDGGQQPQPWQREWVARHRPAFRQLLADNPVAAEILEVTRDSGWVPDFVSPPPRPGDCFTEEIKRVAGTPSAIAHEDLRIAARGELPESLKNADVVEATVLLLSWVWTYTVEPDWERRRRIVEADIVARTRALTEQGWAGAIDDLGPDIRWLGEGCLRINSTTNPPRDLAGADLAFIPTSGRHGWVAWELPRRFAVIYPASGALADLVPLRSPSEPLARLLGPLRAAVLMQLATPKSTSQLVALTGKGLGSVGGHLRVLLEANLVARRRSGHSVLYYRTPLGNRIVEGANQVVAAAQDQ
jgi:DNA-binding transcriptional ArsR family regulator